MTRRIAAVLGALALIFALAAPALAQGGKVVVCKYVGTPGAGERLQTGNNPIVVSANALKGKGFSGKFPFEFSDAQGRSVAIRYAANSHDGDISECGGTPSPTPSVKPSTKPSPTPEPSPTTSPSVRPTPTQSSTPTFTPTPTASPTPTPTGTTSPTGTPTAPERTPRVTLPPTDTEPSTATAGAPELILILAVLSVVLVTAFFALPRRR